MSIEPSRDNAGDTKPKYLAFRKQYENRRPIYEKAVAQPIATHLSDSLAALDGLADEFRKELEKKVSPPNDLSDGATLSRESMAFLYYEIIGEAPQEYEIDFLVRRAEELGLRTIGEARKGLGENVLRRLCEIHDMRFAGLQMGHELLEFGMHFAVHGPTAFDEYRKHIEDQWEEIERFGRAEALAGLPDTLEEFVDDAKSEKIPWEALEELGAVCECHRCGADIFAADRAAEAVLDHYDVSETDVDLEELLRDAVGNCPWEEESVNTSGLCPWCDHVMSKDD